MKKTVFSIVILFSSMTFCFAQEEVTTTTTTVTNGGPGMTTVGVNGYGQPVIMETGMPQINMTVNGMPGGATSTTTTTYSTTTTNGGVVVGNGGGGVMPPPNCMVSGPQFEDIKRSIGSQTFEDTKVSEATQIMNTHCLASWQVRDIMRLFTYENSRLVFAQRAYPRTLDPANYYQVNDAFEFPASINQLNASIGQR